MPALYGTSVPTHYEYGVDCRGSAACAQSVKLPATNLSPCLHMPSTCPGWSRIPSEGSIAIILQGPIGGSLPLLPWRYGHASHVIDNTDTTTREGRLKRQWITHVTFPFPSRYSITAHKPMVATHSAAKGMAPVSPSNTRGG